MAEFEVRDVSAWEAVNSEPIGRDAKLWVREPGAPSQSRERDWLFKPVIVTASGHRQWENWAVPRQAAAPSELRLASSYDQTRCGT